MKMLHLQQIESAIPKIINIELPVILAYKLNCIMDIIDTELGKLQTFRTAFLNKHGTPIEDGSGRINLPRERLQEFDDGLSEILQEEIDIEPVPIPLSLLLQQQITFTVLEIESLKNAGFLLDDINKNEE